MKYQRLKSSGCMTIQQHEGYIICLKDRLITLKKEIDNYETALKLRKKFTD